MFMLNNINRLLILTELLLMNISQPLPVAMGHASLLSPQQCCVCVYKLNVGFYIHPTPFQLKQFTWFIQ